MDDEVEVPAGVIVDEQPTAGSDDDRVVSFALDAGKRAAQVRQTATAATLREGLANLRNDGEPEGEEAAETVTAAADHDHADGEPCACGGACDACQARTASAAPAPPTGVEMTMAADASSTAADFAAAAEGASAPAECTCPTFSGLSTDGICPMCSGTVTAQRLLAALQDPDRLRSATAESLAAAHGAASTTEMSPIDQNNPGKFTAVLVTEEEQTADNRVIRSGATEWRDTPLPLMLMKTTADGHDGAVVSAVIDKISRSGKTVKASGHFDTSVDGAEAARLVRDRVLTSVSIDGGDLEYDIEITVNDDGSEDYLFSITHITILGATIVPFPAIGSATIDYLAAAATGRIVLQGAIEWVEENDVEPLTIDERVEALVAAGPRQYDAALFANPTFSGPTPLRVHPSADGTHRVTGHLALWGECHIGIQGVCTQPPRSRRNYSDFMLGEVHLAGGGFQPVGRITLSSIAGHADQKLSAAEAIAHYDNTGLQAAYVAAGEDQWGIWVAGVLAPGVSEDQATKLAASSLSGDWRKRGGGLELVGVLAVNVPGFPIAHVRSGEQMALVAAGYGPQTHERQHLREELLSDRERVDARFAEMGDALRNLQSDFDGFRERTAPLMRDALRARLAASAPKVEPEPVEEAAPEGEAVLVAAD